MARDIPIFRFSLVSAIAGGSFMLGHTILKDLPFWKVFIIALAIGGLILIILK